MSSPGAPVPLTAADEKRLVDIFEQELGDALPLHRKKVEKLDKWQDAYDGTPQKKRKDFPFPNACNVVIPLIGIAVDSIVARIVNTIFGVEPFWTARPLRPETELIAKPVQNFLEWSRRNEFNMYAETRKWVPEVVKFGWGYLKVPWSISTRRTFKIGENGEAIPMDQVVRRPDPHHVPIRDIITQAGIEDELNQAEWLCHRIRLTDGELAWREHDGVYSDVDEVIKRKEPLDDLFNRTVIETPTSTPKLNTLYEFWATLNPHMGKGLPENFVCTYHRGTKRILRAIYNPNITGVRPFAKAKFIEREGEMEGQGIAARLEMMQNELSTLHCQQVDNATLANTRFFVGRRGAVRPSSKIWPGRFFTVPDPDKDIKVIQMADIYGSMFRLSTEILSYSERASGVSDPFLGRESSVVGTRATATGTLAILQEGNRRFDLNVRDIRDTLSFVGRLVMELNQQYRPRGVAFFVQGAEEGGITEEVLNLPDEFLASRLAIELTASTATINREVEKQGLISLLGLLTQYYERVLQLSAMIENPNVPTRMKELASEMAEGAKVIMERLL